MNNKIIIKLSKSANIIINDFKLIGPQEDWQGITFTFAISDLWKPEIYNNLVDYMGLKCIVHYDGKEYSNGEITELKYKLNRKLYLTISCSTLEGEVSVLKKEVSK